MYMFMLVTGMLYGSASEQEAMLEQKQLSLNTLDYAPVYYAAIAAQLDQQAVVEDKESPHYMKKILPLDSKDDCSISENLAVLSESFLRVAKGPYTNETFPQGLRWLIYAYSEASTDNMKHYVGLEDSHRYYGVAEKSSLNRCSLETLQEAYAAVINELKSGWQKENLTDIIDLLDDDTRIKFTKYTSQPHEHILLRNFAKKFDLYPKIDCIALDKQFYLPTRTICLTIAKCAIDEFNNKFWKTGITQPKATVLVPHKMLSFYL